MKLAPLLLLMIAIPLALFAQEPTKSPISISANADDDVGKEFVYQLRSEIARSGMYRLAKDHEVPLLQIRVLTISEQADESGQPIERNNRSDAASVTVLLPQTNGSPRFLDGLIVLIETNQASAMARKVMVAIDENARLALRGAKKVLAD